MTTVKLRLFNYWRSSASQRVRIGLAFKQLEFEYVVVNIVKQEQFADAYRAKNPIAQVPTLEVTHADGTIHTITQSLPILEYLDEQFPDAPLLPEGAYLRARCRALAEIVNSGIQPMQNLATTNRLHELGIEAKQWAPGFIASGLVALGHAAAETSGKFLVGDAPTIADCCLVPQLGAARRFSVLVDDKLADATQHPTQHPTHQGAIDRLLAIEANCLALPAFANAAPDRQPDAVKP